MPVDTEAATGSDADRTRVAAPSLTPIQVASGPEVEQQLRSARASLASLNLKVRTAARAADLAEAEVPADLVDDQTLQQAAALNLARQRQAEDELAARRTELAADLQREQAEADGVVEAARVRAVAIVAEPTQRLDALLRSVRPAEAGAAEVNQRAEPPAEKHDVSPLLAASLAAGVAAVGGAAVHAGDHDHDHDHDDHEPVDQVNVAPVEVPPAPVADTVAAPVVEAAAVPAPGAAVAVTAAPTPVAVGPGAAAPAPYLAYIVPSPDGSVQPALLRLPTYPQQQPQMMQAVPVQMIAAPAWSQPAPGWGQSAPAWGPPAPGWGEAPVVQQPAPKTPFLKRLMHLDVLLPLLAVVIVLAVLAAWVL